MNRYTSQHEQLLTPLGPQLTALWAGPHRSMNQYSPNRMFRGRFWPLDGGDTLILIAKEAKVKVRRGREGLAGHGEL